MSTPYSRDYLIGLVQELQKLPKETEWVEFKENRAEPEEIGEYISALANSAALAGRENGYLVWGVQDGTHNIVGTRFSPELARVGGEEIENWLLRLLTPQIAFQFRTVELDGVHIVILEIERARIAPVQFKKQEFIRVGSYKKRLQDYPAKARKLWIGLEGSVFEDAVAAKDVTSEEVLRLIDYPTYFDLLKLPLPSDRNGILQALSADRMIVSGDSGRWDIMNIGAILLAKRLSDFKKLQRKAVRVIVYKGNGRLETLSEQEGGRGYAAGFEGLIGFINGILPSNEVIGQALRRNVRVYPELAVRELVANALIHQDFTVGGTGPMIEIFDDRMEITNPGEPLVEPDRFLDKPPHSRNESLAAFMRRIGVCEERGSGVDKVVSQTEFFQLPAPMFENLGEHTRASLFSPKPLGKMEKGDKVRACYLHACLKYVTRSSLTNASLRARFGIDENRSSVATRIINETIKAGLIRAQDSSAARSKMAYVPFWA